MLFSILFAFSFSRKPIYLIPGFTGQALYATVTTPELYPQCPPNLHHFQFFPINPLFNQQYPECLGTFFQTTYNSSTNQITPLPGIHIEVDSFGNVSSFASLSKVVGRLISEGYQVNKTLFGVPYDWVHYYPGTPELFTNLKNHIENIFGRTGEKVILLGHSMGSHVLRLFFGNFTDDTWVKTHIEKVILNAPAFYGCSFSVESVITGILDDEEERNDHIMESIRHMPSIFLLFENFNINEKKRVFLKETETETAGISPSEVHNFLRKVGLLDDMSLKIFDSVKSSLFEKPTEMPVETILFYNSELPTPVYFNETTLETISGKGDGVCQSDVIEKLCSNWKRTKCVNWKRNDQKFNHVGMLGQREELNMISKFIKTNDEL